LFTTTGVDWTVPPTPIPSILSDVGLNTIMVTLMAFMWMPYARLVNANMQQIKNSDYVIAARAVGVRPRHILFRHLLPNALPPIIVLMARDIGGVVILDAAFSFLKLDGMVEWGQLLAYHPAIGATSASTRAA
jgi:ABC-type dipeptide/oligopeptide/nickel transport system permease subunit